MSTINACPECDSSEITRLAGSIRGAVATHDGQYRCNRCRASFNNPIQRERHRETQIRADALAARLEQADPDEVSAK